MAIKYPGASIATPSTSSVSSGGSVSLNNGSPANITSLSLGPGIYLTWGVVDLSLSAVTASLIEAGVSLNSATLPTQQGGGGLGTDALIINVLALTLFTGTQVIPTPMTILTLAASATLYLVAQANFSVGSVGAYGTLNAVRL